MFVANLVKQTKSWSTTVRVAQTRRERPAVERAAGSRGGFVFDATGDGTVMTCSWPILIKQTKSWSTTVGGGAVVRAAWWSVRQFGAVSSLMRRVTARLDVFVANYGQASEVLVHDVRVLEPS